MEACQELLWMFRATSRLVLIQDNRRICIPAGAVQPHIAIALGCLSRLVKHLQSSLIRMENISFEQLLMQALIHRNQIVLRGSQNPVGHGLPAQLNALAVHLLLLSVQRRTHDEFLGHDIGNGFRGREPEG